MMNERIEELAKQADMHRDKFGLYFAGEKHNEDGVDLEKFSQLLIQDCIESIQKLPPDCAFTTYDLSMATCVKNQIIKMLEEKLK
jgi:hypothetical protein